MEEEEEEHMDTDADVSNASFPAELVVAALGGASIEATSSREPDAAEQRQLVQQIIKTSEEQQQEELKNMSAASELAALPTAIATGAARIINIPYILNGELYEIQTQEGENVTVKCCHCPPDRVYRGSVRSTGNFHMHIKRRHPDLLGKLHDMKVNALLERRDRLMRNRKVPTTTSQRRSGGGGGSRISANAIKQELLQTPLPTPMPATQPPQLNLKIRTAFQRHQLQQQQQQQQQQLQQQHHQQQQQDQQNWDTVVAAPFIVVAAATTAAAAPTTIAPEVSMREQPLDYSLREAAAAAASEQHLNFNAAVTIPMLCAKQSAATSDSSDGESAQTLGILIPISPEAATIALPPDAGCQTALENEFCSNSNEQQQQLLHQRVLYNESATAAAVLRQCPTSSSLSSCGSNLSVGDNNINNNMNHYHSSMTAIVKNEPLLLMTAPSPSSPQQAIDLSLQSCVSSSSGLGSAGVSFGSCNNSSSNNNIINSNNNNMSGLSCSATLNLQWQELLLQVENSMRDLQREICARNQIETNRIFLDIAKFKYLHPGFNFQC